MKLIPEAFGSENDPKALILKKSLDSFYGAVENYTAYLESHPKPLFWEPIKAEVEKRLKIKKINNCCRVLEFGAGRTCFGNYLDALRSDVIFDVQDVNDRNRHYLESQADHVYICDIQNIQEQYDVIFSTFVWERLSAPRHTMDHLLNILNPGGSIFIVSPRYDLPGYISPSAKHLPLVERLQVSIWLTLRRIRSLIRCQPDFIIHFEPAIFYCSWFRDADAIHWVSFWDLKHYLPKQCKLTRIRIPILGLRGKLWESFCLLFVKIEKMR